MRRFLGLLAGVSLLASSALAAPIPYVNSPMDTPQALVNRVVQNINAVAPQFQTPVTCSGTTTATCTGLRTTVSVTGLTTAAGVTSATMTVTDTAVTAASQLDCFISQYSGTGNPTPVQVLAAAGSFSFAIQNTHASAALNATVPVVCYAYN